MNGSPPVPPAPAAARPAIPWLACAVWAGVLAIQAILLERFGGDELLGATEALFGRRIFRSDLALAAPAALALAVAHARRHASAYREACLAVVPLLLQAGVFLAALGCLRAFGAGLPQSLVGDTPARLLALGLVLAWLASIVLLLPRGVSAATMLLQAAAAAAFVLVAIAVSDGLRHWFWMQTVGVTGDLVAWMLAPFAGAPVVRPESAVIGTKDFTVVISSRCSGSQGILLVTLLFAGYLWWFRDRHRFPQSLVMFPIGIGLMFLVNAVRIALLILVGIWISPRIAVDGFHSQAGWIGFLGVGLGTIWAVSRSSLFTREPADAVAPPPSATVPAAAACGPSVAACLTPFLALLLTTIVTGAFSTHGDLDLLYPARVVVVAAVLWSLRGEFRWRETTFSPVALGIGAVVFAVWMLLAPSITAPDPEAALRQDPGRLGSLWGSVWLVFRLLGYTVTVPIAEELAFRGFLARRMVGEDVERVPLGTFTWLSFLGSSAAFGALHHPAWLPGTLAGAAFALALYHRRRIVDAIVAHATTNALLSIYVIATGSWASWG